MKYFLPACCLILLIVGCTKKMAPAGSPATVATPATPTTPAEPTVVKTPEPVATVAAAPVAVTPAVPVLIAKAPTEAELAAIKAGQLTYTAKCGTCHGLKPTNAFTAESWVGIMAVMAPKARLSDTEKENVYAYVKANAKR